MPYRRLTKTMYDSKIKLLTVKRRDYVFIRAAEKQGRGKSRKFG